MKKIGVLLLVVALCVGCVGYSWAKEVNVDEMSQEELIELKERINARLDQFAFEEKWFTDAPIEVEGGIYEIGKDIPAGKWKVQPLPDGELAILLGTELTPDGEISSIGLLDQCILARTEEAKEVERRERKYELGEGMYIAFVRTAEFTRIQ